MLPITAIIVTKNEEARIARCLNSLKSFAEIIVVDSNSTDRTCDIVHTYGLKTVQFTWNGQYPKKRQWCLDTLALQHDWVFFIDADEEVTPEFVEALRDVDWASTPEAGFFVKARYVMNGKILRHGLKNNKLCLLHKHRMEFPVVDDLDIQGMGEIEGHYQPMPRQKFRTGQIMPPILHYAFKGWAERHKRYALWEVGMDERKAWPQDSRRIKTLFKAIPLRAEAAFAHSYILKAGFLDGREGLILALTRWRYYRMIRALKAGTAAEKDA